ncbi:MAG: SoxR reducing system RseC family protein [Peptostreptococcaceae bacterium]|nr:SoxR reducing system RseC family protein [Peptostreptococcaceae bacterium]
MDEMGSVVALKDEYAIVNIKRRSACGSCKACEMGKSGQSELNIEVRNTLGAQVGDDVMIEMQTPDILKAAFLVYMIPLLALLGGVTITYFVGKANGKVNEMLMIAVGSVTMLLSLIYVRKRDKELRETQKFEPLMIKVVKKLI